MIHLEREAKFKKSVQTMLSKKSRNKCLKNLENKRKKVGQPYHLKPNILHVKYIILCSKVEIWGNCLYDVQKLPRREKLAIRIIFYQFSF